jgi:hypothetical protein
MWNGKLNGFCRAKIEETVIRSGQQRVASNTRRVAERRRHHRRRITHVMSTHGVELSFKESRAQELRFPWFPSLLAPTFFFYFFGKKKEKKSFSPNHKKRNEREQGRRRLPLRFRI